MWKSKKRLTAFFFLSFSLALFFPAVTYSEVTLTGEELATIRQSLADMRTQARTLKLSLIAQKDASAQLSGRLAKVERGLSDTARKLANSELSLIECQQSLGQAQSDLEILRKEYLALNQSLTKQRNETLLWKIIALISAGIATAIAITGR